MSVVQFQRTHGVCLPCIKKQGIPNHVMRTAISSYLRDRAYVFNGVVPCLYPPTRINTTTYAWGLFQEYSLPPSNSYEHKLTRRSCGFVCAQYVH